MARTIFIAGTGTDVGKTVAAAIVTESLQADYWKPVQAGNLDDTDRMFVENLTSDNCLTHPETYQLGTPASPHDAAQREGITISLETFQVPPVDNKALVIEGAGGLMVPLNQKQTVMDLIPRLADEVILVSANFLGSINHTVLSIEALQRRNIPVTGLVFNGKRYPAGEDWITNNTGMPVIGRLKPEPEVNANMVQRYAAAWDLKKTAETS